MFDYFYNHENEQYLFLQLPVMLIKDNNFKNLSDSSKILYSLLLNRTSLSKKNNWTDELNRVYIIYTIEEIMTDLNCWEQKATKAMKELKEIGLIKSVRQGLGKPNIIYVMNFATVLKFKKEPTNPVNTQTCENHNSRIVKIENQEPLKITIQELPKSQSIYNDLNNLYVNDIDPSHCQSQTENQKNKSRQDNDIVTNDEQLQQISLDESFSEKKKGLSYSHAVQSESIKSPLENSQITNDYNTYKAIIQENIDYTSFQKSRPRDIKEVDELVNVMLDVICTKGDTVKINGEDKNRSMVISQYLKIDYNDIEHVLERFKEQHHKVTHLYSYLRTMLYTVKQEGNHYYTNQVRADGVVF